VEESHLTIEQAQSTAKSLATVAEPAGCCWCVGLWDLEEEEGGASESPCWEESLEFPRRRLLGRCVNREPAPY
jgi:hypothetical protein